MAQGQTEAAAGWQKAFDAVNAQNKANRPQANKPLSANNAEADEAAAGWDKAFKQVANQQQ